MDNFTLSSILEKTAKLVEEYEAKISSLEDTLAQVKQASYSDTVQDLVSKGFSQEEADTMIKTLPGSALNKVASYTSTNNWNMGSVSEVPGKSGDPMLDFIYS
jgi:NAD+--asparagine ADP-ribosyltransferase